MKAIVLSLSLLLAPISIAVAAKPADEFVEIKAGTAVTIRPDRAYLLFRTNSKETRVFTGINPVFLRIPTAEEMEVYEAEKRKAFAKAEADLKKRGKPIPSFDNFNFVYDGIQNIHPARVARALEKSEDGRVVLIEARPGTYVFYGWGQGDILLTCLCLGTVSFPAEAGRITDLGTLLMAGAADPSPIPELKAVTGLGASMNGHVTLLASAIRPADASTARPAVLAGKPVVPARYRAVGKFVSPFTFTINRLVPIPGVLGYDRGTVLDLVSNTPAEDHHH